MTTGFIGFCLFNMIAFLIGFIGNLMEDFNIIMPTIAWQLAMVVTPGVWITRNKKIIKKIFPAFAATYFGVN